MTRDLKSTGFDFENTRGFFTADEKNFLEDFYKPFLNQSVRYIRHTGFIDRYRLEEEIPYYAKFGKNGKVEIISSHNIPDDVLQEIAEGESITSNDSLLSHLNDKFDTFVEKKSIDELKSLVRLYHLVALKRVEIRIALVDNEMYNSMHMFHHKVALFEDESDQRVMLSGSENLTKAGGLYNFEHLNIYYSWDNTLNRRYIEPFLNKHLAYWKGEITGCKIISGTDAINLFKSIIISNEKSVKILKEIERDFKADDILSREWVIRGVAELILKILASSGSDFSGIGSEGQIERLLKALLVQPKTWYLNLASRHYDEFIFLNPGKISDLNLFAHQISGAIQLVNALKKYDTVVLADNVGLGKTRTALMAAWYMLNQGNEDAIEKLTILAPKKIHNQWIQEIARFGFHPSQFLLESRDKLSIMDPDDQAVSFIQNADLVIIDEAHEKLRNHQNKTYQTLNHIATNSGAQGLLLTATPLQNTVTELYNLAALFGNENLGRIFHIKGKKQRKLFEGNEKLVRDLWKKTYLQRTKYLVKKINELSETEEMRYEYAEREIFISNIQLTSLEENAISDIIDGILRLSMPVNTPLRFFGLGLITNRERLDFFSDRDNRNKKAAVAPMTGNHLVKVTYLKRLESSLFAFITSIFRLKNRLSMFSEKIQNMDINDIRDFLREKVIKDEEREVRVKDDDVLYYSETAVRDSVLINEINQFINSLGTEELNGHVESIIRAIEVDLELIKHLLDRASELIKEDQKLKYIRESISSILDKGEKVIVFSSYDSTIRYVFSILVDDHGDNIGFTSGAAAKQLFIDLANSYGFTPVKDQSYIGRTPVKRELVANLFAPIGKEILVDGVITENLGDKYFEKAKHMVKDSEFNILLGTDTIATGQNFQDATNLINLDLPYNPMTLEQRIGRIDRPRLVGTTDFIHIYNCLVSSKLLDETISILEILKEKLKNIYKLTDFDSQILSNLELLKLIHEKRGQVDSKIQREINISKEMEEFIQDIEKIGFDDVDLSREETNASIDCLKKIWMSNERPHQIGSFPVFTSFAYPDFEDNAVGFILEIDYQDDVGNDVSAEVIEGMIVESDTPVNGNGFVMKSDVIEEGKTLYYYNGLSFVEKLIRRAAYSEFDTVDINIHKFLPFLDFMESIVQSRHESILEEYRERFKPIRSTADDRRKIQIINIIETYIDEYWDSKYSMYIDELQLEETMNAIEQYYVDLPRDTKDLVDSILVTPERFFDEFDLFYQYLVKFDPDRSTDEEEVVGILPTNIIVRLIAIYFSINA